MIWSLKTEEGREVVAVFIADVIKAVTSTEVLVETSKGEGQGEASFENISILGQEDGDFSVTFAAEIRATRWEPSDVDVAEVGVVATLPEALTLAIKTFIGYLTDQAIEAEVMTLDLGEEEGS